MDIQDGKYRAKAKSWALAEASTGNPEVAVEFEFAIDESQTASLTWHGFLGDNTFDRTIESLRFCGWTGDDLTDLSGLDTKEVVIVIENEEYKGKVSPKIQWVNRAGGLAVKTPMSAEKAKTFAAAMRGKIRALDAAKGVKPPPKPANGGAPKDPPLSESEQADDLPF